jgi:hypothetical protein
MGHAPHKHHLEPSFEVKLCEHHIVLRQLAFELEVEQLRSPPPVRAGGRVALQASYEVETCTPH